MASARSRTKKAKRTQTKPAAKKRQPASASKKKASKTTPKASSPKTTESLTTVNVVKGAGIAPATFKAANGSHEDIYKDAVAEIKSLADNDAHAKRVDNGPLNEARGKDTWRLHAQLRAVDQLDKNLNRYVAGLRQGIQTIDEHVHQDAVALSSTVTSARNALESAVGETQKSVSSAVQQTRKAVMDAVNATQITLSENLEESSSDLGGRVDKLAAIVKSSFDNLTKATAGTEENLRTQTNAFSTAVEQLLGNLQHEIQRKILDFRDESTRQVDKRFNQSDVAFAAIRAELEVVKALLTDIIKDRMGRPDAKNR